MSFTPNALDVIRICFYHQNWDFQDLTEQNPTLSASLFPFWTSHHGNSQSLPGVKRPTAHSSFELLYMILYIGGGHTAGCAVLAFVCLQ